MNLSISNFRSIYKIIFILMGIFGFYNLFIILQKPNIVMFQNQWQQNYAYAQNFIYGNKANNIIVGSSMAARMQNNFLPKNFYNLSFSGGSVLTGLEIIKRSGFVPKNIYIETNLIFRDKDESLLNALFYPIIWRIKQYIPALQIKYQPLNVVMSKLRTSYGKTHKEHIKEKRNEKIFHLSMTRQLTNYNQEPKNYANNLANLEQLIEYFKNKGVHIVFFEMPMEKQLQESVKILTQRKILADVFSNQYVQVADNNYTTADGIHLLYSSAYKFSKQFIKGIHEK
ncbi:hypothetical protein [Sulfurimonas sp.]